MQYADRVVAKSITVIALFSLFAQPFAFLMPRVTFAANGNGTGDGANIDNILPAKGTSPQSIELSSGSGDATYQYPVTIPSGRRGMQPSLALAYSSNGENGWIGKGWSLGYAPISRSVKYGPPQYNDSDRIEDLQTGQELVLVDTQNQEYRAKIDNYQRYRRLTDGAVMYWERTEKDGTVMRFGYTADSRQTNASGTFAWYPDRITDTSGNFVSFEYQTFDSRVYPKSALYTGSATTEPQFKIDFVLTDRNDNSFSYITTTKVELKKRLSEIRIFQRNGQSWDQRGKYALSYQYSPDTGTSLLQSIQRYGFDDTTTFPATTFTYKTNAVSYSSAAWQNTPNFISTSTGVPLDQGVRFADVNGDGLEDSVMAQNYEGSTSYDIRLNTGAGFVHSDSWTSSLQAKGEAFVWNHTVSGSRFSDDGGLRLVDVNADLYPDLVVSVAGRRGVYLNTKNGWAANDAAWSSTIPAEFTTFLDLSGQHWSFDQGVRFTDVNGDGYVDIVIGRSETYSSNVRDCGLNDTYTYRGVWLNRGKAGAGWVYDSAWSTAFANLGAFFTSNEQSTHYGDSYCRYPMYYKWSFDQGLRFTDVNGDGLPDVIWAYWYEQNSNQQLGNCFPYSSVTRLYVYLNNGNGWVYEPSWSVGSVFTHHYKYRFYNDAYCEHGYSEHYYNENWGTEIVDLNGDGLPDMIETIVSNGAGYKYAYLNTGTSFVLNSQWATAFPEYLIDHTEQIRGYPYYDINRYTYDLGVRLLDVNGDKRADVLRGYNGTIAVYLNTGATATSSDSLMQVDNGIGGQTTYAYQPSTKFIDATTDLPMVRQMLVNEKLIDRGTEISSVSMSYDGGLYDATDREYRGFKHSRVTTMDSVTETTFLQDDIFKGKIYKSEALDLSGHKYAAVENSWNSRETVQGKDTNFPYLEYAINSAYDGTDTAGKKTKQQYEYDGYGNVSRVMDWGSDTGSPNGDEKDQRTEYVVNTTKWIVNTPRHLQLLDSQGAVKSETWLCYDNQTPCIMPPNKGLVTSREELLSGGTNPISLYTYDEWGNQATSRDANNNLTMTTYDSTYHAYPASVTNALNHIVQYAYDGLTGNVLTATDANNRVTQYQYDAFGRTTAVIKPYDSTQFPTIKYQYRDTGPVRVIQDHRESNATVPTYLRTWSFYDGFGRLVETKKESESPSSQVLSSATQYDSRGRIARTWLPYLVPATDELSAPDVNKPQTVFSYDSLSRLTRTTHPNGTYVTTTYLYWTRTETDENGHAKDIVTDGQGQTTSVKERNSGQTYTTSYQFDVAGRLVRVNDVAQNQWTFTYDTLGRKTRAVDPDMGTWNYTYDAVGNMLTQTDARGSRLSFQYDSLNRILKKYTPAVVLAMYTYDDPQVQNSKGRLTKVAEANGNTSSFAYDQRGRELSVATKIDGTTYTVVKTYDAMDRIVSLQYPDNEAVWYTYNAQGNVNYSGGTTMYVSNANYNAADQPITIVYGNNAIMNLAYDEETMRLDHFQTMANQQLVQYLAYAYDNVGNVAAINDTKHTATQSFGYDDLNRLTSATGSYGAKTYSYNAIGNITSKEGASYSYSTSKPHAVRSIIGGQTFSYDANGNITAARDAQFTYDINNRLATYNEPLGTESATFTYDWQGNRVKKSVTTSTPDPACSSAPPPDAWAPESAWSGVGAFSYPTATQLLSAQSLQRESLYEIMPFREIDDPGGGGGGCLPVITTTTSIYIGNLYEKEGTIVRKHYYLGNRKVATRTNGTLAYFMSDHLGSTNITTAANGSVIGVTEYMPFGEITNDTNTSTDYKYNGKELDTETGLYYYGSRYYDPALGRFMAADSLVPNWYDPQSLNRYSYARNNPIKYIDPTGHFFFLAPVIFYGIVAIGTSAAYNLYEHQQQGDWTTDTDAQVYIATGAFQGAVTYVSALGGPGPAISGAVTSGAAKDAVEAAYEGEDLLTAATNPENRLLDVATSGAGSVFGEYVTNAEKALGRQAAISQGKLYEGGLAKNWNTLARGLGETAENAFDVLVSNQYSDASEMDNGADSSKQTTPRTTEAPTSWMSTDSSTDLNNQGMCSWDGTTPSSNDALVSSPNDVPTSGGSSSSTSGGVGGSSSSGGLKADTSSIQYMISVGNYK